MARRFRGTSLVELIVVMAIMMLVVALLLPAAHGIYTAVKALGPHR